MNFWGNEPIFKELPYALKKRPTLEGIKDWLAKQKRMAKIFRYGSIAASIFMFLIFIYTGFRNLDHLILGTSFASIFAIYSKRYSKLQIHEEEIMEYIESKK